MEKEKMTFQKAQEILTNIKFKKKGNVSFLKVNYNYFKLEDIKHLLNAAEIEYTLALKSSTLKMDEGTQKLFSQVRFEFECYDFHINDLTIELSVDFDIKQQGGAISYARRYALINVFNLDEGGEKTPEELHQDQGNKEVEKPIDVLGDFND